MPLQSYLLSLQYFTLRNRVLRGTKQNNNDNHNNNNNSFVCQRALGRSARHHALNDLAARSFASAGVTVTKEPIGLFRTDGKRSDGVTLVHWQSGKSLCWDVTVTCPLAESYIDRATLEAGAAAEMAATRKEDKYDHYIFEPLAVETLGIFNTSAQCSSQNECRLSTNNT